MTDITGWYAEIYATEDNGSNPFARPVAPRNPSLHANLRSGSILDFPRKESGNVISLIDRVLGIPGAIR